MSRFQVEISREIRDFIRRQPPEPRRQLRNGLRGLTREEGDIKALQGDLEGFFRLRIGHFRLIFRYESGTLVRCLLLERRALIYEVFSHLVKDRLRERAPQAGEAGAAPQKTAARPVSYAQPRRKPPRPVGPSVQRTK